MADLSDVLPSEQEPVTTFCRTVPALQRLQPPTGYQFAITLPGYAHTVEITLNGDQLMLRIECHSSGANPSHHTFRRCLRLPPDSLATAITTRSRAGLLEVHVPRRPAETGVPTRLAS